VIIDDAEVFVFHYEADAWDTCSGKCFRNYVNDDIMICLSIPRTEDEMQEPEICGHFKLRETVDNGDFEWQRQPFEFALKPERVDFQNQTEHGGGIVEPRKTLKQTEVTLEDEEQRLLQQLEKIRERKIRLRQDSAKRSLTTT